MSARARLSVLGAIGLCGSFGAYAASRAPWVRVRCPAQVVDVPGLGRTSLSGTLIERAGTDLVGAISVLVIVAVLALAWTFFAGPRARALLFAAAATASLWLVVAAAVLAPRAAQWSVGSACGAGVRAQVEHPGARWWAVVSAGVVVLVAVPASRIRLPRARMPEVESAEGE